MNQMTQGEAVYQAIVMHLGEIDDKVELNSDQKRLVYQTILTYFNSGMVTHKSNPDEAALKKYIPGLVNNWLRKDPRLNGGQKYVTKNPGVRAGSGDEQLKAMRALLSVTTDESARGEIERAIELRREELKPKVQVNLAALPEALRHLVK